MKIKQATTRKAKDVFLVLIHSKIIKDGKEHVVERCEFVDVLKKKHIDTSTVVIDYLNERIVKNRGGEGEYSDFVSYITDNYPDQMGELQEEYKSEGTEDTD